MNLRVFSKWWEKDYPYILGALCRILSTIWWDGSSESKMAARKRYKPAGKLGAGTRFRAMTRRGMSPALAAWIGRKKYGAKRYGKLSGRGRSRAAARRKR